MRTPRIPRLVIGGLLLVIALPCALAAAGSTWINIAQRDDDGWFRSDVATLETDSYALTSERLDLHTGVRGRDRTPFDIGTVEVAVESPDGAPVFVGIAPATDVAAYLGGTAHARIDDVRFDPVRVAYADVPGDRRPAAPGAQTFWTASSSGGGRQTVRWDIEGGEWAIVVMSPDAQLGVQVEASAGLHTDLARTIALVLGGLALLFGLGGGLLVASGVGTSALGPPLAAVDVGPSSGEPVRIWGALDPDLSRWRWLVKWLLALPHLVVLALLWPVFVVLTAIAGIAILFTGSYPARLFDVNVGILRWTWRVTFYAFALGTDRYPPFSLRPDPTYPAGLSVDRPTSLSRGLVLVKWWLLALPHYLVLAVFGGGITLWFWGGAGDERTVIGGGLVGLLAVIAGVALLVTKQYPRSIFDFVMGMERWTYRVLVYAALLRDEYPPFRLDLGSGAPSSTAPGSSPSPAPDPGSSEEEAA